MIRTITLKRDGECHKCGHALEAGRRARWSPPGKVWCLSNGHHGHLTNAQHRARVIVAEGTRDFIAAMGGSK